MNNTAYEVNQLPRVGAHVLWLWEETHVMNVQSCILDGIFHIDLL